MPDSKLWMRSEIAQWLREGLISDEQAERLLARYPDTPAVEPGDGNWGKAIFAAIGALLIGAGVILVFAYNWSAMSRYSKLSVILGALLLAHLAGWIWRRRDQGSRLGESLHVLGTMLFGAGIWLIAQIYHIDAHYPDGFWLWGLGALAMAWALPSVLHGLLATALLLVWTVMESADFGRAVLWGGALIAVAILPLAYRLRSPSLLSLALLVLPAALGLDIWRLEDSALYLSVALLAASYLLLAPWLSQGPWPLSGNVCYRTGLLYWVLILFVGSFISDLEQLGFDGGSAAVYVAVLSLLCLGALLLRLFSPRSRPSTGLAWLEVGVVTLPLLAIALSVLVEATDPLLQLVCNVAILAISLALIYSGTESVKGQRVVVGCGILTALAIARFGDLFTSLLSRAGVFLLLGAALFVVGLRFSRQQTRRKLEKPNA